MKVLVTGATGFTGSHVVPMLLAAGVAVRCFIRNSTRIEGLGERVEIARGELEDPGTLRRALEGCDALVNIASLGFGHAAGIVGAAQTAGISRGLFVSTTGIFTALNASSKAVRVAAEKAITSSRLDYTILRPTMIYGSSRDRNICRLIRFLNRWPAIPVMGSGEFLQQPVYVGDLANAIVQALLTPESRNKAYNISGAEPLTYNEVIHTVCSLLGRRVQMFHMPARPVVGLLRFAQFLTKSLPIKAEQVERLNEDKAFAHAEATQDFGFRPLTFREGVRLELQEMGLES